MLENNLLKTTTKGTTPTSLMSDLASFQNDRLQ